MSNYTNVKNRTINWTAFNPSQLEFVNSKAPFVLGAGGMGSGKTVALVRRAILMSINSPFFGNMDGNVGVIGRWKKLDFEKTTYLELMRWLPKEWIVKENKNDGVIELYNKSIIHVTHFDSVEHILSYNVGWAAIDQLEQIPVEVFEELAFRRVRLKTLTRHDRYGNPINPQFDKHGNCISTDPDEIAAVLNYHTVFGVCNPKRCFLHDRFVRNEEYGLSSDPEVKKLYNPDFHSVIIPTTENQMYLPTDFISRQKRTLSEREYKRFVGGMWDAFEGQVYEDFTESRNVRGTNFVPPPDWKFIVTIDHGGSGTPQKNNATNTTAVLFEAYNERGTQYPEVATLDELYLGGSTIEETVIAIDNKLHYYADATRMHYPSIDYATQRHRVDVWRCDPSMARGIQDTDESIMEAYMRHARNRGFTMALTPANNDVMPSIQRVNWMFRQDIRKLNPKCIHLIDELKSVEFGDNEKVKPLQADHLTDTLRMSSMSIFISVKGINMEEEKSIVDKVLAHSRRGSEVHDDVFGSRYRQEED